MIENECVVTLDCFGVQPSAAPRAYAQPHVSTCFLFRLPLCLQVSVKVRVLSEGCTSDVPPLMRQGFSSIHPALTRPWDLQLLVGRVRQVMELVLLPVRADNA